MRRPGRVGRWATASVLTALAVWPVAMAQGISGTTYEDRNANGIRDPEEPAIEGVDVELFGQADVSGSFDQTITSGIDGSFVFDPGTGCYVVLPADPSGWRMAPARSDLVSQGTAGYQHPWGWSRFGKLDLGLANLKAGAVRYTSMGDSIAWNWNVCSYDESFWYSKRFRDRLQCAAPGASITLDQAAVKGEHTDDLLVDDTDDLNNVFRVVEAGPQLITISMIGNDLLGVDAGNSPTQQETNTAVEEVLDARQNLQEAISWMVSALPDADVTLNTLYDNLAYGCYDPIATTDFHRTWLPIINRMLRDLAWGQARRVSINEVAAEFAVEDLEGVCTGFDRQICRDLFAFDDIHPNNPGYEIILEKVWEGAGGVNLGTDATVADYGFLRHVRRLYPTAWEVRDGAVVDDGDAALGGDDGGAAASIGLGLASEEFRLTGFPDWYDEIRIVKVVAGVRYRTTGTFADDLYRVEASPAGVFRPPPGHSYTPTDWDFYTPIVGGGGPNAPASNADYPDARLLVFPDVASFREVSATLTTNPVLETGAGQYTWPALTHEDIATTAVRVAAAPVGATPGTAGRVEVDAAWLDLYGWETSRPQEVRDVRVERLLDGTLEVSFAPVAGAQRYNVYFGRLSALQSGGYDHGGGAPAGPDCDAPTRDAGGGRLEIVVAPEDQPADAAYVIVTAHAADVESPTGARSDGTERDRSQSICR